ncbi:MAG: Gfo/Idh/MocA family oxidoreductase [Verrucomicrobiae bacterium]|nr:Gfo/Idh/MocA family oxidoreductase [Verrucomicrobiae bacterium]
MSTSSRRHFLKGTAAAVTGASLGPAILSSAAPNAKVAIACIGVGGKGWTDMLEVAPGNEIVAICDIDEDRLGKAAVRFDKAKKFTDWRKLLEQPGIDAVMVSTPDHTHAPATATAMGLGLHCYTQKPLTHSIHEARRLTELAAETGVITQMGIQHHATKRIKTAVHAIREDRVIGKISEVHAWTDRPINFWKQGLSRPEGSATPPSTIHWDQWLGVAPERPFVEGVYLPFKWRGWWDFGTGVAGDMGCHILDPIVDALELGPPSTIEAEGPAALPESGPEWCVVHYVFPGNERTTDTLKLTWYEAGKMPPRELFQAPADWPGTKNGILFVGEKGNLFVGFPEMPELFPKEKFADYQWADLPDHSHYGEWTQAIRDSGKTSTPFSYAGPLTETVLLGNVAHRSGSRIEWDSMALKVTNVAEANRFLKRDYRKGWEIPGLG